MIWIFGALFIIGIVGSAFVITRKIPLVLSTPRQVIDDYFQQETARVHIRSLRIKAWFQRGEYMDPLLFALLRMLRSLRVGLLKLERNTFVLTQKVNELYEARKNGNGNGHAKEAGEQAVENSAFWNELKTEKPGDNRVDSI